MSPADPLKIKILGYFIPLHINFVICKFQFKPLHLLLKFLCEVRFRKIDACIGENFWRQMYKWVMGMLTRKLKTEAS